MADNIFRNMFDEKLLHERVAVWKVLCKDFFQRYIDHNDVVLDIGAGFCEFINNIKCGEKIAFDLNDHTRDFAGSDITVIKGLATELSNYIQRKDIDVVFASNFFEHLKDKNEMTQTLQEIKKVLRPQGKLLVLQPNIRYAYKVYWDFYDHHIPISHNSFEEVLVHLGFHTKELIPRFLPWTTKSSLPKHPLLVKLYLKLKIAHYFMGKQFFICSTKMVL